jgi:hypothetical protein
VFVFVLAFSSLSFHYSYDASHYSFIILIFNLTCISLFSSVSSIFLLLFPSSPVHPLYCSYRPPFQDYDIMGFGALLSGRSVPKFRGNLLVSSRHKYLLSRREIVSYPRREYSHTAMTTSVGLDIVMHFCTITECDFLQYSVYNLIGRILPVAVSFPHAHLLHLVTWVGSKYICSYFTVFNTRSAMLSNSKCNVILWPAYVPLYIAYFPKEPNLLIFKWRRTVFCVRQDMNFRTYKYNVGECQCNWHSILCVHDITCGSHRLLHL